MSIRKRVLQILFFLLIMGLTFYTLFHGQDLDQIRQALVRMNIGYLLAAVALALFFVSAEGIMIWYLLHSMNGTCKILRCIQYSFIGFFYSGITPSATGGQPMQLYYMKKDGNRMAESSVVLMTVALLYKLVLVLIGAGILVFRYALLKEELKGYFALYILGLFLNSLLVFMIFGVMMFPGVILRIAETIQRIFIRMKIWKPSVEREEKIRQFLAGYQQTVKWLAGHRIKVLLTAGMTFLQRCSVFMLTYVVYLGFGLEGARMTDVMILQASVYIAVDMLPLPGAQGITELMYQTVFANIFPGIWLLPSMMVSRGINFYFLLIFSLLVTILRRCENLFR